MTINIADNTPRVSYTVAQGVTQTSFTVTFEFFAEADLNVYIDGVLKTLTTDYTVTGGDGSTGSITMSVTGASGGSTVVITRQIAFERTTDFPSQGAFQVTTLNTELDRLTAVAADLNDEISRSLRLTDYDSSANLTLPDLASRAGKVLAFDAVTGDLVNGPSTAGVTTVAAAAADIATLADIEDGTVATNAISNTATVVSDIPTVAGVASDVSTVAGISSDVTTVANNVSDVTAFAQIYRVGSTDPTSNNDVGDLFYNTTLDTLKIWTGAAWVTAASEISGYLPVTGGTITGDLTLSGGGGSDVLFDQSRKILHFKDGTKAAFGGIPSSSANPDTADIEIYRNNLDGAVIGFADTSTSGGTKIPSYIKNTTADVNYIQFTPTQDVALFYNGVEKFATENTGVGVIGDINVSGLVDGRDVAADGTKLDGIEASADVTDAGNVNPLVDAHLNQSTAASGEMLSWNGSDYDWVTAGGGGDLLAANNLSDVDNAATSRTNLGVAIGSDVQAHSSVLDGTTASFTTAKDSKLTGIESGATADQTDAEIRAAVEAATDSNVFTDADHTKLNGIATGATAYGDSNVDTHLNTSTAAASEVLSWTGTDYDWVAQSSGGGGISNVVEDTTPQLGGDLQSNGNDIVFADNDKALFGANTDLEIYSDGTSSFVHSKKAGAYLRLKSEGGIVLQAGNGENVLFAMQNGKTALYFDAAEKLETTSSGVSVTGTLAATAVTGDGSGLTNLPSSGGADLYAANESSPAAQPSATGGNAIAIGDSAVSSGDDAVALGVSRAGGDHSFAAAIANGTSSYGAIGNYSIAIGFQAKASNFGGAAFGKGATTAGLNYNVALGNSYTSGADAFAAAIASNSSSYGATGNNSIAIGSQCKATGNYSISIGRSNNVSGPNGASALGQNCTVSGEAAFSCGNINIASGAYSQAIGNGANTANIHGKFAKANGYFSNYADAQYGQFVLRGNTTDATAKILTTNNGAASSTNQIILANTSAYAFHGTIVGREDASDGTDCCAFKVEGLIRREANAGTTVLVNSATTVIDNTPNWSMALSADTTNGGLAITMTGAASTNIRFVATIHTSEVIYS